MPQLEKSRAAETDGIWQAWVCVSSASRPEAKREQLLLAQGAHEGWKGLAASPRQVPPPILPLPFEKGAEGGRPNPASSREMRPAQGPSGQEELRFYRSGFAFALLALLVSDVLGWGGMQQRPGATNGRMGC